MGEDPIESAIRKMREISEQAEKDFEEIRNRPAREAEEARRKADAMHEITERMAKDPTYNPFVQQPGESEGLWRERLDLIFGKEADEPADSWRERLEGFFGFDPLVQRPGESVVAWRERLSFIFGFDPLVQQSGESVVTWHRRLELIFGKEEVDAQFAFVHELLDAKSERGVWRALGRWLRRHRGRAGRAWVTWLPVRPTSNRGGASDELL